MAFDAFMELLSGAKPAVQGETLDKKFGERKAFELTKFKLASQWDLTKGEEAGEDEPFILKVEKEIDNATPDLYLNFCRHTAHPDAPPDTASSAEKLKRGIFDKAIVTLRKAAGAAPLEYLVFEFTDVYIKTWKLENTDADSLPEELVDFCFHACKVQYNSQKRTGTKGTMSEGFWDFWDLNNNRLGANDTLEGG